MATRAAVEEAAAVREVCSIAALEECDEPPPLGAPEECKEPPPLRWQHLGRGAAAG